VSKFTDLLTTSDYKLPLLIFLAEMCVVTLGTIRIIFIARGMKLLAPLLGFFEVMTWLFAISQIMQNLHNGACFLAFAGGFTAGNFVGIQIEKRLALGSSVVRVIIRREANDLIEGLRAADYGVTTLDAEGANGPVRMVYTIVKRKEVERVVSLIKLHEPTAVYAIDELQAVSGGIFPGRKAVLKARLPRIY
jgi:uncharacterized protein YebE (UPF0316 family)